VPSGKVTDVQRDVEVNDLMHRPLGEKPLGNPALIEYFDGA
jgi:hypothetical protein